MRFLVIYKKYVGIAILTIICCFLLSISYRGVPASAVYFGNIPRLVPIYSVDTEKKQVAISFDSAWGADKTTRIIETLNQYNVGATFFLVGFWVEEYPEMVELLKENNIEIGTHSNTHPDFTTLSAEQIRLELSTSIKLIEDIIGDKVELFRAPFGAYNNTMLEIAEKDFSLKTIQWDVDTLDWKGLRGMEICERVMNKVQNGSIILCHNNSDHILDALPLMLERLINAGYEVTSIGNLIMQEDYYIDNLGIQRKN